MSEVYSPGGGSSAYSPGGGSSAQPPLTDPHDPTQHSVGELISEVSKDFSTLMRQELELAKAELKQEATKAGKGAGMLAGAGYAGHLLVLFLSVALMAALDAVMPLGWAALIVAVLWGIVAAVLATRGRAQLKNVNPKPERTVETLKEDAQWAKHPTR